MRLHTSSGRHKLIVLFSDRCGICIEQLNTFNRDFYVHPFLDIVFLTTDVNFLINHRSDRWPSLSGHAQVIFGVVKRSAFRKAFGTLITPSFYLFDHKGTLVWRKRGRASFDYINKILLAGNSDKN